MNRTSIKITLSICGNENLFDIEAIAKTLGETPTASGRKGELLRLTHSGKEVRVVDSYIEYEIPRTMTLDSDEPMGKLVEQFESKIDILQSLKQIYEVSYRVDIMVEIVDSQSPALGFNQRTIQFLEQIGAEVSVDLYVV